MLGQYVQANAVLPMPYLCPVTSQPSSQQPQGSDTKYISDTRWTTPPASARAPEPTLQLTQQAAPWRAVMRCSQAIGCQGLALLARFRVTIGVGDSRFLQGCKGLPVHAVHCTQPLLTGCQGPPLHARLRVRIIVRVPRAPNPRVAVV